MWVVNAAMTFLLTTALLCAQQGALRVDVLEGEGAINNIGRRTAWEPVVRVTDTSGSPVSGAVVTFILPAIGAGGTFADGSKVLSIQTDESGRAVARGLKPNRVTGRFEIRVTATQGSRTASTSITQTNAAGAPGSSARSKKILILGLVAGGVAGGVAFAARGKSSSSSTSGGGSSDSVGGTITPGQPGFGPPK